MIASTSTNTRSLKRVYLNQQKLEHVFGIHLQLLRVQRLTLTTLHLARQHPGT